MEAEQSADRSLPAPFRVASSALADTRKASAAATAMLFSTSGLPRSRCNTDTKCCREKKQQQDFQNNRALVCHHRQWLKGAIRFATIQNELPHRSDDLGVSQRPDAVGLFVVVPGGFVQIRLLFIEHEIGARHDVANEVVRQTKRHPQLCIAIHHIDPSTAASVRGSRRGVRLGLVDERVLASKLAAIATDKQLGK